MSLHPIFQGIADGFMAQPQAIHPAPMTPAEARERLKLLGNSNDIGDGAYRMELQAILKSADEVEDTDPIVMVRKAEGFERNAVIYEREGKTFWANESWEAAARYRRCAARSMANDNATIEEAA